MYKFDKIIHINFIFATLVKSHLKTYSTPSTVNYNWSFGSLTGFFLLLQLISGIFLSMYYVADVNNAFESIQYIMRDVHYGWLMRYTHLNSASFFFYIYVCSYVSSCFL